jgi:F-type H+-transporting ATPase subunit c
MPTSKKWLPASLSFAAALLVPALAFAQEAKGASSLNDVKMYVAIGVGMTVGLAVLGGAIGQGRAGAAALEGIARNPGAAAKIQTLTILVLALVESLVIFAVGVSFFMMQTLPR